jgi:short-subunit dehydrogenase
VHVLSVHPGAVRTNIFKGAIASSQNPAASKQMFDLVQKVAMAPDKAAARIVQSQQKSASRRVIVGLDARMVEITKRLMPVLIHRLFAWAFGKRFR